MSYYLVIPARYQSTRFPGKVLAPLLGKPLLQHVYERVQGLPHAGCYIATDTQAVQQAAEGWGASVLMTASNHPSGTDRIADVVRQLQLPEEAIVVNVQGDEPLINPEHIELLVSLLQRQSRAEMATLCHPLSEVADLQNPNMVKVVCDQQGFALYFSRAGIPFYRDGLPADGVPLCRRHIGLYAYRVSFLQRYCQWPEGQLEQIEKLEQLRVLEQGESIIVGEVAAEPAPGVDTPEDLQRVAEVMTQLASRS